MRSSELLAVAVTGVWLVYAAACSGTDTANDGGVSVDGGAGTDAGPSPDGGGADGGAQPSVDCNSLPNPIYIQIGDTQEPLIKALARKLRDSSTTPMTIVYRTAGSCTNIEAIYTGVKMTMNPFYVPSTAENAAWTDSMPSLQCKIDPAGKALEVANSNVFNSSCASAPAKPANYGTFLGSNQSYVFVEPTANNQPGITAEQAYFVFGFGAGSRDAAWNDPAFMFIRPATKSTLVSLANNIKVPAAKWKGTPFDSSSQVVNAVSTSASPQKTIGILGVEIYDANRATLKSLPYKAFKQQLAYLPDSTASSRDKRSMRDGHYTPWSPTVYMAEVDTDGTIKSPNAKLLIDLIQGAPHTPDPGFNPLEIEIKKGLVPACAMHVSRTAEGGDLALAPPAAPCDCFFEATAGSPNAACVTCSTTTPCATGTCRNGFCETGTLSAGVANNPPGCVPTPPTSHTDIINACVPMTTTFVDHKPTLPLLNADASLPPLPN